MYLTQHFNYKMLVINFITYLFIGMVSVNIQASTFDAPDTESQEGSNNIMDALGLRSALTNEDTRPLDLKTQRLSSSYHPLQDQSIQSKDGRELFRLTDSDEIVFASSGQVHITNSDDNWYRTVESQTFQPGRNHAASTTMADVDSDGVEEIITVINTFFTNQRIFKTFNNQTGETITNTRYGQLANNNWRRPYSYIKAIGGDFSGDGHRNEMAVLFGANIIIYKYNNNTNVWQQQGIHRPWEHQTSAPWNLSMDAKNIDDNPGLEIVVTYSVGSNFDSYGHGGNSPDSYDGRYELFRFDKDYQVEMIIGSQTGADPYYDRGQDVIPVSVALAQLIPGGPYEVAIAGAVVGDWWNNVKVMTAEINLDEGRLENYQSMKWTHGHYWNSAHSFGGILGRPEITIWPHYNDGDALIFAGRGIKRRVNNNQNYWLQHIWNLDGADTGGGGPGWYLKSGVVNFFNPVDKKNYPELVYMWIGNQGQAKNNHMYVRTFDGNVHSTKSYWVGEREGINRGSANNYYPWGEIIGVNWRKDERIGVYAGHDLRFTEPQIFALLASPPYYRDQNVSFAFTGLRFSNSQGSSEGVLSGGGFGIDLSLGIKSSAGVFFVKDTITTTFSLFADSEWTTNWLDSISKSISESYYAYPGEDKVVASVIPIDHYVYQVTNTDNQADTSYTEGDVVIDVPRMPYLTQFSVDYMHESNMSNQFIDADAISRVLQHTPGDPGSYMSRQQAQTIINNSSEENVTFSHTLSGGIRGFLQGTGKAYIELSIGHGANSSINNSFRETVGGGINVEHRVDFGLEGLASVGLNTSAGFRGWGVVGNSWSTNFGAETSISTFVPDVTPENIADGMENFGFGLIGHSVDLGQEEIPYFNKPLLVTYWTEDASDHNTNLALHKPVTMSSTYSHHYSGAEAVDGINDQGPNMAHTSLAVNGEHWIKIDLEGSHAIDKVLITNRVGDYGGCCSHRLNGARVHLYDENNELMWTSEAISGASPGQTFKIMVPSATSDQIRYVEVKKQAAGDYLNIAEIKVF